MKKTSKLTKILAASAIALASLGVGNVAAQEANFPKNPKVKIELNYENQSQDPVNYSKFIYSDLTKLSSSEWAPIRDIRYKIQTGTISDYSQLVSSIKDLSANDQRNVLSWMANDLYLYNYSLSKDGAPFSSDDFFKTLYTDITDSANASKNGVCREFASAITKLQTNLGKPSATMGLLSSNGVPHADTISKTENGLEIINSYQNFTVNSKNAEEAIRQYQKTLGYVLLQSEFYGANNQWKYTLTTEEGKNFINFLNYKKSLESLTGELLNTNKDSKDFSVNLNLGNETSMTLREPYLGVMLKGGVVGFPEYGQSAIIGQFGNQKTWNLGKIVKIHESLNGYLGSVGTSQEGLLNLPQTSSTSARYLLGWEGNLGITTTNQEGLNLGVNASINSSGIEEDPSTGTSLYAVWYSDLSSSLGVSYTTKIDNFEMTPYAIGEITLVPKDLIKWNYEMVPSSAEAGIQLKGNQFTINPSFVWKPWEIGGKLNASFGNEVERISLNGGYTSSTYELAPSTLDYGIGASLKLGKNSGIKMNYNESSKIYDNKPTTKRNFNINLNLKF